LAFDCRCLTRSGSTIVRDRQTTSGHSTLYPNPRKREAAETSVKISELEHRLGTVSARLSGTRRLWLCSAIVGVGIAIACIYVISSRTPAISGGQPTVSDAPIMVAPQKLAPVLPAPPALQPLERGVNSPDKLSPAPAAVFSAALNSIDDAVDKFPDRSPEELLRAASLQKDGCMLQWNDRRPSLLFGSTKPGPNAIASSLFHCAEVISSLR
jgi:hypothetical protein